MQSFLTNLLGFLLLSVLVLYGICRYSVSVVESENLEAHYLAAMIDKHERLSKLTASGRVIFVGNSNLAFGLDSKKMSEALGKPVVNLGLHGALGLDFIVAEALDVVTKNDVVILCIPHYLSEKGDPKMLDLVNRIYPKSKAWTKHVNTYDRLGFRLEDGIKTIQKARKQGFRKKLAQPKKASVYQRAAFNEYGDVVSHLSMSSSEKIKPWSHKWDVAGYRRQVEVLTTFGEAVKTRGAEIYLIYPCFLQSAYKDTMDELDILKGYYNELPFPVLGKMEDFVYSEEYFFDTVYHLNKKGRVRWNEALTKLLSPIVR